MNPVTHAAFRDELEKLANANPQLMVEVEASFGKEAGFLSSIFGGKGTSDVPAGAFDQAKRNSAAHAAQQATTRNMGGAAVDPFVKMRAGAAKTQVIPKKIPKFAEALTPEQLAKLAATLVNPAMNPGHLESPKMAAKKDEDEKPSLLRRAAPVGAAAALAGLGTYGALRKFRPSAIPELRALQEKAKDKAFEVATSAPQGRGLRSMLFGAKDIPSNLRDTVGGVARPGATVLQHTGNQATTHGAVTINAGVLPGALDDKHTFSQVMQHGTGGGAGLEGAIPKTDLLKQRLREVPHEHLSKAYPTGYVIKPRTGSMSKAENLLTEATPADDPRLREALRNPGEFIIQEKIPIQKEFRVHLVNNVPFTASHRELPHEGLRSLWNKHMGGGGGAFVPVMGEERQRLMDFARNSTKHIGQTEGGNLMGQSEHLHHALDIARLPDGSFKVIESNPTPGTLMNPIVSRKLQHMVTGRVPKDVAALGGLGAAAGTGLAAHAIMNRDQREDR